MKKKDKDSISIMDAFDILMNGSNRIHFDKKCLGRLVAWTSAKEIYNG